MNTYAAAATSKSQKLLATKEVSVERPPISDMASLNAIVLHNASDEGSSRTSLCVGRIGYHASGHHFKGKRHVLEEESDLGVMYSMHDSCVPGARRSTVYMWAEVHVCREEVDSNHGSLSRGPSANVVQSASASANHTHSASRSAVSNAAAMDMKMAIVEELKENHGERGFSDEQFHVWAYMVSNGKAELDEPPKKIFWPSFQDKHAG